MGKSLIDDCFSGIVCSGHEIACKNIVTREAIRQWFSRVTKSRVKIIAELPLEWQKSLFVVTHALFFIRYMAANEMMTQRTRVSAATGLAWSSLNILDLCVEGNQMAGLFIMFNPFYNSIFFYKKIFIFWLKFHGSLLPRVQLIKSIDSSSYLTPSRAQINVGNIVQLL